MTNSISSSSGKSGGLEELWLWEGPALAGPAKGGLEPALLLLVVLQRHPGIDPGGAPGRAERGNRRDRGSHNTVSMAPGRSGRVRKATAMRRAR